MPSASTRPVRVRSWDTALAVQVRRVVAYRAECACGWQGSYQRSHGAAQHEARAHNLAHRNGTIAR